MVQHAVRIDAIPKELTTFPIIMYLYKENRQIIIFDFANRLQFSMTLQSSPAYPPMLHVFPNSQHFTLICVSNDNFIRIFKLQQQEVSSSQSLLDQKPRNKSLLFNNASLDSFSPNSTLICTELPHCANWTLDYTVSSFVFDFTLFLTDNNGLLYAYNLINGNVIAKREIIKGYAKILGIYKQQYLVLVTTLALSDESFVSVYTFDKFVGFSSIKHHGTVDLGRKIETDFVHMVDKKVFFISQRHDCMSVIDIQKCVIIEEIVIGFYDIYGTRFGTISNLKSNVVMRSNKIEILTLKKVEITHHFAFEDYFTVVFDDKLTVYHLLSGFKQLTLKRNGNIGEVKYSTGAVVEHAFRRDAVSMRNGLWKVKQEKVFTNLLIQSFEDDSLC